MMEFHLRCQFCTQLFEVEEQEWLHLLNDHRKHVLELGKPSYAMVCPKCRTGKYNTHHELLDHIDKEHDGKV